MSRWLQDQLEEEQWGPSHQRMEPPFQRRHPFASCFGVVFSFLLLLFFVGFIRSVLELKSGSTISWTIGAVIVLVVGRVLLMVAVGVFTRTPRTRRVPSRPEPLPSTTREPVVHVPVSPAARPLTSVPGWGVVRAAAYGAARGDPGRWPGPVQVCRGGRPVAG